MNASPSAPSQTSFRQFFLRGLAILLPTVLTIWILIAAYQFVAGRIAQPINRGMRELILAATPWPTATLEELSDYDQSVRAGPLASTYRNTGYSQDWLRSQLRRHKLETWWARYALPMDLIGLALAVAMIYMVGLLVGSFIGRRLYHRGEMLLHRLPLIGRVYPAVKQVTDFFMGDERSKLSFSRVVAVQYPRRGIWSVGMVTGDPMAAVQDATGEEYLTIFIPSSPTPFTGYVIMVPRSDTIDLPITVEDAVKFVVSGGVLIPPSQKKISSQREHPQRSGVQALPEPQVDAGRPAPAASDDGAGPRPGQDKQPASGAA